MGWSVEQAADEGLPTGDELDLIEEERDGLVGGLGEQTQVGVGNHVEIGGSQACQAFVLEVEVEETVRAATAGDQIGAALMEETGLPGPAHADDGDGFPGDGR